MHTAVEHVAKQIDDLSPHPGAPRGERVRAQEQDRPHHVLGQRQTDADRMGAQQVALKDAQLIVRDPHRRKVTESRVHPVDGLIRIRHLPDDLRCLLDLTLGRAIQTDRDVTARDRDHVGDREVMSGKAEGRYLRFSRYQRARSV